MHACMHACIHTYIHTYYIHARNTFGTWASRLKETREAPDESFCNFSQGGNGAAFMVVWALGCRFFGHSTTCQFLAGGLTFSDLTYHRNGTAHVKLKLELKQGRIYALTGPNGAGHAA